MTYDQLSDAGKERVQLELQHYFGQRFVISELDEFFSNSGMQYGYIAFDSVERVCMVCDCTPDSGDMIIASFRY